MLSIDKTMNIRLAEKTDVKMISDLLEQLGYRVAHDLLKGQLNRIFIHPDHAILVYEQESRVLGFVSVHFLPQLANDGNLAIINYLAVDSAARGKGIGKALEDHVNDLARERKCERIQLHCKTWRTEAHNFYKRRGYQEYPTYFSKRIIYAE
jgi:GNAT superfamily N-acetyltransferase